MAKGEGMVDFSAFSPSALGSGATRLVTAVFLTGSILAACTEPGAPGLSGDRAAPAATPSIANRTADDLLIVDCLLPGQVRKLGSQLTFVAPRRPIKTAGRDCEIRGGEYVSYDRADYRTALRVWMESAQAGDPAAQTYVAEIYERGLSAAPNYQQAAAWYEKAARSGYSRAAVALANLYEKGLGVPQDSSLALKWYTQAAGVDQTALRLILDPDTDRQIKELKAELAQREAEMKLARKEIEKNSSLAALYKEELAKQQTLEPESREKEIANLKQAIARLEQKAAQERKQRLAEVSQIRKELEASRDQAAQYRKQLEKLQRQQENASQQEKSQQAEEEISRLRQEISVLEENTANLEQALSNALLEGPTIEIINPPLAVSRSLTIRLEPPAGGLEDIRARVLAPAGLELFSVNGRVMSPDQEGVYSIAVPASRGSDSNVELQLLAVDAQGKQARVRLVLLSNLTTEAKAPEIAEPTINRTILGKYHALVIGNDDYLYWGKLDNAVRDARAVEEILREKYGFETTLLINANRRDILVALNQLTNTLTRNDNLLIFYAGHGHLDPNINRGYWIPVDGAVDDRTDWILTFNVTDLLSNMAAKHVLIIADSCYSGTFSRSGLEKPRPGITQEARMELLANFAQKRVRSVLSSGGIEPVLDGGIGGHSVFTSALLEVLRRNTEVIETERLFWAVRQLVADAAKTYNVEQIPTYEPIRSAGHEAGDFLFFPIGSQA